MAQPSKQVIFSNPVPPKKELKFSNLARLGFKPCLRQCLTLSIYMCDCINRVLFWILENLHPFSFLLTDGRLQGKVCIWICIWIVNVLLFRFLLTFVFWKTIFVGNLHLTSYPSSWWAAWISWICIDCERCILLPVWVFQNNICKHCKLQIRKM